ncbi:protein FAM8A1 isoform X2 [Protopterus annectens]|uniref:protein FAM8A1 isoform X2 n=1 Tax=Protopterus annectens TaxID=7888 RepID=UPI001CFA3B63|nr:protein FAM8A1 isoform X2 [Protopterus annectens]
MADSDDLGTAEKVTVTDGTDMYLSIGKNVFGKAKSATSGRSNRGTASSNSQETVSAGEYSRKVQEWLWLNYCSYVNWQSYMTGLFVNPFPGYYGGGTANSQNGATSGYSSADAGSMYYYQFPLYPPQYITPPASATSPSAQQSVGANQFSRAASPTAAVHRNGNIHPAGREYFIPSLVHRFIAEIVDFFILFFIKAAVILSIMHISEIKDISKFAMHYIVEEIDDDTSMEDLQKMMIVALVYRVVVCFYEIACIWGAGGATPGKFLLGLRVVTCDTSVLVGPNRVLVIPSSNVTFSAYTGTPVATAD